LLVVLFSTRTAHALQHDRIDPTELLLLKDEIESLKAEKLAWETEKATHTEHSTEHQDMITKNDQTFWQRMSTLGAESTQLKSALEAAKKESASISEERDALKAAAHATAESTAVPLIEEPELEWLRKEKRALEQALQERSKSPLQASIPDTSDLEVRLVRIVYSVATKNVIVYSLPFRPLLLRSETNLSQKRRGKGCSRKL
jgi:hypothetical protein